MSELRGLFRTPSVARWASPPERWSYSSFSSSAECPRRWSLERSEFLFGDDQGPRRYPRSTFFGTLRGTVVHKTIDRLMRELSKRGIRSVFDSRAPEALRELGGLYTVTREVAAEELQRLIKNPRAARHIDEFSAKLDHQLQEIAAEAKRAVRRTNTRSHTEVNESSDEIHAHRGSIGDGEWSEVELAPPGFAWQGIADHISVRGDSVSISDYKTGETDEAHRAQLELYALLWSEDHGRNPRGLRAEKLRIIYTRINQVDEFPGPTPDRLEELKASYSERAGETAEVILRTPPSAKPSPDACRFCGVRQLCPAYWTNPTRRFDDPAHAVDVKVALMEELAPGFWKAAVLISADVPVGTSLHMRIPDEYATVLSPGDEVLALAYNLSGFFWDDEEGLLAPGDEGFLSPSPQSELYEPPKSL